MADNQCCMSKNHGINPVDLQLINPLDRSDRRCFRKRLLQLSDHEDITIAYPDEGAWKRFHLQLADYPEASDD